MTKKYALLEIIYQMLLFESISINFRSEMLVLLNFSKNQTSGLLKY